VLVRTLKALLSDPDWPVHDLLQWVVEQITFQYSLPSEDKHLLAVFRLPGAEAERVIKLRDLQPERNYWIEGEGAAEMSGRWLMEEGVRFEGMKEEEARLVR
jgi:alpha-galactosidase